MLQIYCKNNHTYYSVENGSSLLEVYQQIGIKLPHQVACALVNNTTKELNYRVYNNKDVEFLDLTTSEGMRTYVRSVCFVLYKAVAELFPKGKILMEHPVSNGYFCDLRIGRGVTEEDVQAIKLKMQDIVSADIPFEQVECHTEDAIALFRNQNRIDKVRLLETSKLLYTRYYKLGDTTDYYYGSLLPSTAYIYLFDLLKYEDGLLLLVPDMKHPQQLRMPIRQEKMFAAFKEHLRLEEIGGMGNVGDLNHACMEGHATMLINVVEALQEKQITHMADEIYRRCQTDEPVKLVLISGPSSSGKTTFSKRLSVQLMANGLIPYPISLDNYFLNRADTPLDEHGEYDFESLYALDLELFNAQMKALLEGEEVSLPTYNFTTGLREYRGEKLKLSPNMILVMEGNHALNPDLTPHIPDVNKYKIYVSALTTISLDDHNWIPTTDNRLIRRILRDYLYRGYSAKQTIMRWPSVRQGEDKWIFPFQENADATFNSALLFEMAVLRPHVEPVLREVPQNCDAYAEAHRLLKFLRYFQPVKDKDIPPTSLLREFFGGSSFNY